MGIMIVKHVIRLLEQQCWWQCCQHMFIFIVVILFVSLVEYESTPKGVVHVWFKTELTSGLPE